jgi:hypothetical protein
MIDPRFLHDDDFDGVYGSRATSLSQLVCAALKKPSVIGEIASEPLCDDDAIDNQKIWGGDE